MLLRWPPSEFDDLTQTEILKINEIAGDMMQHLSPGAAISAAFQGS